jgi:hypothetical protein
LLATDEQFQFHEQWKYQCIDWLAACNNVWVTEVPIIAVAVLGSLSTLLLYRQCINNTARILLLAAISCGLLAIYVDLFAVPYEMALFEEGFEVVAEALWLAFLLALKDRN